MARKWLKKCLARNAKPSNSDIPAVSSEAPPGNVSSTSETSGNASRGPFFRARNLHPSRVPPGRGSQGPAAESDLGPVTVGTQVDAARLGLDAMTSVPRMGQTAADYVAKANTADADIQSLKNTYLQPLKLFNSVVTNIANVHPYAQVALGILTAASNV
ncbi:hypothetical protein F5141DRAFT_707706 [Pisolithus sp. B1]|nr:hypothetical protein F5141DRAFT_707706 [Pisolithus sp. B1]